MSAKKKADGAIRWCPKCGGAHFPPTNRCPLKTGGQCPRCGLDVLQTDVVDGRCGECRLNEDEADWTDEAKGPLN